MTWIECAATAGRSAAADGAQSRDSSCAAECTASCDPRRFYWVTTGNDQGGGTVPSRLWRLNFDDPRDPARGGTIDTLLAGGEGHQSLDNLTVDRFGRVLIQEDPGNNPRIAKIWSYGIAGDTLTEIAQHDPARFGPTAAQDEESSGIIALDQILRPGAYLLDVQWHSQKRDTELVEGGQLQALYFPPGAPAPGSDACSLRR